MGDRNKKGRSCESEDLELTEKKGSHTSMVAKSSPDWIPGNQENHYMLTPS